MTQGLRPYQQEQIHHLRQGFRRHQRQILCSPTGSGKTVVMASIIDQAVGKGSRVLVLTDRIELFEQTFGAVSSTLPGKVGRIRSGKRPDPHKPCSIAMVETLNRRLGSGSLDLTTPDLVIIDECHIARFNKVIERFPSSRVIGLSATPTGKHIKRYYEDIVQTIDIPDLIEGGYLVGCRAFEMVDKIEGVQSSAGDFKKDEMYEFYKDNDIYAGVIEEYQKRTPESKALVFNINIDHAVEMHERFLEAGINSEVIHSKTPKEERKRIISAYKQGLIPVLNNCGILTTGFDDPSIETIIMNRATRSLPLFLQCCGRGSRIHPGKSEFTLLDFGGNIARHGRWQDPREFRIGSHDKRPKEGEAPVKACPGCDAMIPASSRFCEYCGREFPPDELEEKEGEMREVPPHVPSELSGRKISDLSMDELIRLQKAKKYKPSFVWRVLRTREAEQGGDILSEFARMMGYKPGWIKRQRQEVREGKVGFTDYVLRGEKDPKVVEA